MAYPNRFASKSDVELPTTVFEVGNKVRVKLTAPRHGGQVGYIDLIGENESKGTVIICSKPRDSRKISVYDMFAVNERDLDLELDIPIPNK